MAFRRMETSLGPGLGLGIETRIKGPPFWTAWYCVAVAVAIVVRLLLLGKGSSTDFLAIQRQDLGFGISSNSMIPHESLVEVAKRARRSFARVSMRDDRARCKVMRIVAIVYFCITFNTTNPCCLRDKNCSNHAPEATGTNRIVTQLPYHG